MIMQVRYDSLHLLMLILKHVIAPQSAEFDWLPHQQTCLQQCVLPCPYNVATPEDST